MKKKKHIFKVGEIVNNSLKIVSLTRDKKQNKRAYEVQSLNYPDAPTYIVTEYKLLDGKGCGYTNGSRVYEGNSLWSEKHIRKYIVNPNHAKTVKPNSNKKIEVKCPDCNRKKEMLISGLTRQGFVCLFCSKGISYPELFVISYLDVKGIEYEHQKRVENLGLKRFDFYIKDIGFLEVNGIQHYEYSEMMDYEQTIKSDIDKRVYCKENNIELIELDCRKSDFSLIKEKINKCKKLPNIEENDIDKILELIEKNKRHPTKKIIEKYKSGETSYEIGVCYNISPGTVRNILRQNNVTLRSSGVRKRRVTCITTSETFESATKASEKHGISINSILDACNGKIDFTGKISGNILYWEFTDNQ